MTSTLPDLLPAIGYAASPRFHPAIWPLTAHADDDGRLCIGEVALTEIADEFGTPAYAVDEAGEMATAMAGGVDKAQIVLHGNAKTQDELRAAVRFGIGRIVLDSSMEITELAGLVEGRQRVLIRVTPDLDIHGHRAVTTGVRDQKFGFALDSGHTVDAVARVVSHPSLQLIGFHCHLGSQVTDAAIYGEAIRRVIAAMADVRASHGVIVTELNIVGGHGIPYLSGDPELDVDELSRTIAA